MKFARESQSSQDVPKGPTSAVVDANKPVPNMETVGPPADTDSERAIEKPAGSDSDIVHHNGIRRKTLLFTRSAARR
jgi:hypothetical protein